ncbi:GNAT family N-acetyltransferase [Aliikangiella coralliicola]|uniref:GNAT family N-acetyltransferase n=1 Tax=Aliikangiella coralliicola TaxID=2592383 RepID=A0A545TWJ8_9GAMM|nr:GNAT family N-acetyltransferase [Aliikangiella coralliicola]TQV81551.1 GNAT family N-acetyltransferase [Aliikangiella coralliicola]
MNNRITENVVTDNVVTDNIIIRAGTESDCDLILDFINKLAEYEKLASEVVATQSQLKKTLFGSKAYAEVIIAELAGNPVGFALYFYNYSTFLAKPGLYLEDLYVLPEARGKKVGKALLIRLAKIALENDCGRFEWSVLDWNQPAIDFYRSIGAIGMEEWTVQRVDGDALSELANKKL